MEKIPTTHREVDLQYLLHKSHSITYINRRKDWQFTSFHQHFFILLPDCWPFGGKFSNQHQITHELIGSCKYRQLECCCVSMFVQLRNEREISRDFKKIDQFNVRRADDASEASREFVWKIGAVARLGNSSKMKPNRVISISES